MSILSRARIPGAMAGVAFLVAACGGDPSDDGATQAAGEMSAAADAMASATSQEDLEEAAQDMADSASEMAEELQAQQTGGSASITVGDQTWTFDGALCAFGEDETGQEGAEFVLSSIGDGLQLYLSIDSFGHSASINDIEDFENPSVSWEADTTAGEFINVNGKNISGEARFIDYDSDSLEGVPGSFEATCP